MNYRDTDTTLTIRPITPTSPDFAAALHEALDLPPPERGALAQPAEHLLMVTKQSAHRLGVLLGAFDGQRLIAAVLCVASPGDVGMVLVPTTRHDPMELSALAQLLRQIQTMAWADGQRLLQILLPIGTSHYADALKAGGFRRLTRLLYLRRRDSGQPLPKLPTELEWVNHSPETEPLFLAALEASYAQSLDCPELTGLRTIRAVLAGHRATGAFDPAFWWVALRDRKPVGIVLLGPLPDQAALELVYMGVAQPARGSGVANALLTRAVAAGRSAGVRTMALAVDERNRPARRLYTRWGFVETGVRDAWIASP